MLQEFHELNLPPTFSRTQFLHVNIFPKNVNFSTFVRSLFLANSDVIFSRILCINHEHGTYVLSFHRIYFQLKPPTGDKQKFLISFLTVVKSLYITLQHSITQCSAVYYNTVISLLKTKRNLLYIRNQSVPRSKHFPPRL